MTDHDRTDTLVPDEGLAPASTALPTTDVMEELATHPGANGAMSGISSRPTKAR